MSDNFYNQGYEVYCRTLEARQRTPVSFLEYVAIQKKVFIKDLPAEHGPVSIIKMY